MADNDDESYKIIQLLDSEQLAEYICVGGSLSKQSENFEERKSQIELLKKIAQAFNNNQIAAFEAGTGVGKSYAYLIPSMIWALNNNEKVVISTGTINLQQQLAQKDIPAAEKILGKKIKSVLLKGRQNFICKRRLKDASLDRELFNTDLEFLDKIVEWEKTSQTGSKSELSFNVPENVWSRVCSESDVCMGLRCPLREKCFVMKVREEANDANILVLNHHLLFADIEARMLGAGYDDIAVLPPYKRIVFDEAHGIESAATSFFSESVNRFKILRQLNLMYRQRKNSFTGYILTLLGMSNCQDYTQTIFTQISEIKNNILNFEIASLDILQNEFSIKIDRMTCTQFAPVISLLLTLGNSIMAFAGTVREIMDELPEDATQESVYWESKSIVKNLEMYANTCKNFSVWEEKPDTVFWIQKQRALSQLQSQNKEGDDFFVTVNKTPLDISKMMNDGVFEPMQSVINTSATLQINNSFDFFVKKIGINYVDPDRVTTDCFDSPFEYEKNVLLAIPNDVPLPHELEFQSFINKSIIKLIKSSEGRTLVLFTSYESMNATYFATKSDFYDMGIEVLKHGDDDRFRLLDRFKNENSSVLFATDSFWQGVDVPGNSLSQVIIVKLPFSVPFDPVFAARCELIEKRGGSSFMELSLPEAIIKFRQGFGRLVRRKTDKGVVVVLDKRICVKQYGTNFINSLPDTKKIYAPIEEVVEKVKQFLH